MNASAVRIKTLTAATIGAGSMGADVTAAAFLSAVSTSSVTCCGQFAEMVGVTEVLVLVEGAGVCVIEEEGLGWWVVEGWAAGEMWGWRGDVSDKWSVDEWAVGWDGCCGAVKCCWCCCGCG